MAAGAENTATFAIDLNAQGAVAGADQATDALRKLSAQVEEDEQALAGMQRALKNLKGGSSVNIKAFHDMTNAVTAQKAKLAQNTEALFKLGGAGAMNRARFKKFEAEEREAAKMAQALAKERATVAAAAAKQTAASSAAAAAKQTAATSAAAAKQMAALGGVATVLVAVAAAAVVAAGALLKYGIAAADAYRSERLQIEGLTKVRNWYGIAAGSATEMQAAIDRVSASSALGRDQIVGLHEGLYKANLRGEALADALDGLAIAQSAAGAGQAAMYQQMIAGAGRSSAAVKRVTDDIRARFGGVAKAQMLSLSVQSKKLQESFQGLFRGLNLDGLLSGLKMVTDLFSQNTASGRALKQILEVVLQPLIDGMAAAGPIAKRFFQGMVLAAQSLVIAYYDVRLALKSAFADEQASGKIGAFTAALGALRAYVWLVGAGFTMLRGQLERLAAPFLLAITMVGLTLAAFSKAYQAIKAIDWGELGMSLIDGFVGGIVRGVGRVVTAVTGMASAAKNALKQALDSHSPSRVGMKIGATLPQGGALGIQRDTPLVARAARRMAVVAADEAEPEPRRRGGFTFAAFGDDEPKRRPATAAAQDGQARQSGASVTIAAGAIQITIQAAQGAQSRDLAEEVGQELVAKLKGVALSIGAAT